jgi:epoxyqueuosine reductase
VAGGRAGVAHLRGPRLLNAKEKIETKLSPADLKSALAREAQALGFDCIGVTDPGVTSEAGKHFQKFLEAGAHGDMDWLAANPERRMDPRVLWPGVRSIIMLGVNYGPEDNPLKLLAQRTRGAISAYAQGDDYHDVIKSRLKAVARWLVANAGGDVKVFVDTAAVMEKPLAAAASLGWQGKHTNLVSRQHGSWLFLGAIFTTLELAPDAAEIDHCGTCSACLDVCPTNAFPAPYRLDARRCISYLTIEHKGPIPRALRPLMGNRIYGCDDCLAVCPWNKFAQAGHEAKLAARESSRAPGLAALARLDDAAFRALFAKSPVKRTGRDRFVRNVLIAIGNSGDGALATEAERLLDDASPLVRGAAVWALGRLDAARLRMVGRERRARETDETVQGEWSATLSISPPAMSEASGGEGSGGNFNAPLVPDEAQPSPASGGGSRESRRTHPSSTAGGCAAC